jgi:hypothetical protein
MALHRSCKQEVTGSIPVGSASGAPGCGKEGPGVSVDGSLRAGGDNGIDGSASSTRRPVKALRDAVDSHVWVGDARLRQDVW